MEIGGLLLILAVFVVAAAFIVRPLLDSDSVVVSDEEQEHSALLAERERVLNALSELDFDHQVGKVPEATYLAQRQLLLAQGTETLRKLDALEVVEDAGIQQDEVETLIAARRKALKSRAASVCPECGEAVAPDDKFCAHCGQALA